MTRPPTLLENVAGLIQRTYRIRTGLAELGAFVIGDGGYRELYGSRPEPETAGASDGCGARTLIRQTPDGIAARVYFPDALIRRLEAFPPQRGVGQENLNDFATFVEEIDHLLVIAECSLLGRGVSRFELELHANVSKHLVLTRFIAGGQRRLGEAERIWLRRMLFDADFTDDDPAVRRRYHEASRWAVKLLERIPALGIEERIATLRRFHNTGTAGKLQLIERLAA